MNGMKPMKLPLNAAHVEQLMQQDTPGLHSLLDYLTMPEGAGTVTDRVTDRAEIDRQSILSILDGLTGERAESERWLVEQPLAAFAHQTGEQVLQAGGQQAQALLTYVEAWRSGAYA